LRRKIFIVVFSFDGIKRKNVWTIVGVIVVFVLVAFFYNYFTEGILFGPEFENEGALGFGSGSCDNADNCFGDRDENGDCPEGIYGWPEGSGCLRYGVCWGGDYERCEGTELCVKRYPIGEVCCMNLMGTGGGESTPCCLPLCRENCEGFLY